MNKSQAGKLGWLKSRETHLRQKQDRLEEYNKNPTLCLYCGKPLPYKNRKRKFCNNICSAYYNKNSKHITKDYGNCLYCGTKLKRPGKYCTCTCASKHKSDLKYQQEIQSWKDGTLEITYNTNGNVIRSIKRYLLCKYNYKCSHCGWGEMNPYTGRLPLEVHHIDGDWKNNVEENLTILCPNCHSLTKNYKASNKGHGRNFRRIN